MVEVSVDRYASEIEQLYKYTDILDPTAFYVAGATKQNLKFDLSLEIILRFLSDVVKSFKNGDISAEQRAEIECSMYKGIIGEAKAKFNKFKSDLPPLVKNRSSQFDFIESKLKLKNSFSEVQVIDGVIFLRNPATGELVSSAEADRLDKLNSELISNLQNADLVESQRLIDEDERVARELQAQYNMEQERPVVEEDVLCKICLEAIPADEYLPLESCGDLFHPICINTYLKTQTDNRQFPLLCPLPECKVEISMIDISERLTPEDFAKFEEYSFNHFVQRNLDDMTCCPTPNCRYVFSNFGDVVQFLCPVCSQEYCLSCKCVYHHGKSCEEFIRDRRDEPLDKAFFDFALGSKFKMCSRCKFWVEKSEGCDHMTCKCGNEFCYACGGPYGNCHCSDEPRHRPPRHVRPMRPARPVRLVRPMGLLARHEINSAKRS